MESENKQVLKLRTQQEKLQYGSSTESKYGEKIVKFRLYDKNIFIDQLFFRRTYFMGVVKLK